MTTRTVTHEIPVPQLSLEHALWALAVATAVADIATTQIGLQAGLDESNPIARSAIEATGMACMVALKAGATGVALLCRPLLPATGRLLLPVCLAAPWALATAVNCYLIVVHTGVVA